MYEESYGFENPKTQFRFNSDLNFDDRLTLPNPETEYNVDSGSEHKYQFVEVLESDSDS